MQITKVGKDALKVIMHCTNTMSFDLKFLSQTILLLHLMLSTWW